MRVLTWNINSVRLRLPLVLDVLQKHKPDVFCLQETKTPDEFFPADAFRAAGYTHQHIAGMKGYNGVAILSRLPLDKSMQYQRVSRDDKRHISAVVKDPAGDFMLHNVYIPAGGYEPDVTQEKFRHKLDFVDDLADFFAAQKQAKKPAMMVGDLNIAPLENDVWDHKKMVKVVSHTPVEIEKFAALSKKGAWYDAIRHFVPEDKKLYTWWSYRAADWDQADKGRRLDHMWVTDPLKSRLQQQAVLRELRGAIQPSDHVPVILDLKR
jgi:exodeoxyribonuclease-3